MATIYSKRTPLTPPLQHCGLLLLLGLACPWPPHNPSDSSSILLPIPPWDFFPDHPSSAFFLFQDGITSPEGDGPSHLPSRCISGIGGITMSGSQVGGPRLGRTSSNMAPPPGWGRMVSLLQTQPLLPVPTLTILVHPMDWTSCPAALPFPTSLQYHQIQPPIWYLPKTMISCAVLIPTPTAAPLIFFPLIQDLMALFVLTPGDAPHPHSTPRCDPGDIPITPLQHWYPLGYLQKVMVTFRGICQWHSQWQRRQRRGEGKVWMVMNIKIKGWERIISIFSVHISSSCSGTCVFN